MLDAKKIVNGSFCRVFHEGEWMMNVTSAEVSVEIGKEEVNLSGTRWVGHKTTTLTGEGSFTGYKTSHYWTALIGNVQRKDGTEAPFVTELVLEVNDPESPEAKTFITLQNVQFDNVPILSFENGSLVEEEINFTFRGWDRR